MNETKCYLGVDIGGMAIKIGIVEEDGTIRCQEVYPDNFDQYKTPILETALKSTELFLKDHNIPVKALHGIGVSATGLIDEKKGMVIGAGDHLPNWNGSHIKERMEEQFRLPVTVVNDANCAALGELFAGAAKGEENVIVVTVGTGIGGGIIVNSKLLMGAQGLSGEIGNMMLRCEKNMTSDSAGSYEKYAATTALVNMVKEGIRRGSITGLNEEEVNGKLIFDSISSGNSEVQRVADEWMNNVAAGMASLVYIFNPDVILIGGGVSAQKELFVEPVRRKVLSFVDPAYREHLRIEPAALGNDAGMVGAVYYCMQHNHSYR